MLLVFAALVIASITASHCSSDTAISIFVLGGEILRGFALAMIIGVIIGTYSSMFVASPILKYLNVSYKTIAKEKENN